MGTVVETMRKNRTRLITLSVIAILFVTAIQGMDTEDWVITVLRGLSVGALTFLVAAGFSLILGLMDVLNLAHGELFMIGAYIGWTVFVRPDTFIDVLPPVLFLSAGFLLLPVWRALLVRSAPAPVLLRWGPWGAMALGVGALALTFTRFPIAKWDPKVYAQSPITFSLAMDQGNLVVAAAPPFGAGGPLLAIVGTLLGGALVALAIAGLAHARNVDEGTARLTPRMWLGGGGAAVLGGLVFLGNDALTGMLFDMGTTCRFFLAMAVATGTGFLLGGLIESVLIRPLYDRPIYQIMLTLGIGFIGIELVRAIWGRPEFTMPKPDAFSGTGAICREGTVFDQIANSCSTITLFDGRVRTYNEVFVILVGLVVLIAVWLLLQRTRIGMIIRAGVQDSDMVEALGINVRRVFTFVFALGVGLAALGGVLAGPSVGLSTEMGTRLLLLALIALAIGGLTSFPGAAAGAVLVGLLQQFIIKYGQIGINLPFLAEPFKPSPPLVPASTVLLMVIILLVLPNGLFGRSE